MTAGANTTKARQTVRLKQDRIETARGGHGFDIQLTSMRTTPAVYWTKSANSYVAHNGRVYSVNGIGEIRWLVEPFNTEYAEVMAYFYTDEPEPQPKTTHTITRSGGTARITFKRAASREYNSRDEAATAWLRRAKADGRAIVLGGGWWQLHFGSRIRRVQGIHKLGLVLEAYDVIHKVPAASAETTGIWAWTLAPRPATTVPETAVAR